MQSTVTSYNSATTKPLFRATQIVWYIAGFIEVILGFRFLLKLFAANPNAGFTEFIYNISYPFAAPFLGVFQQSRLTETGSIFEWTTLLAMLVYWLVAWGLVSLFVSSKTVSTPEASVKLDDQQ
jgi:hypothetical protein